MVPGLISDALAGARVASVPDDGDPMRVAFRDAAERWLAAPPAAAAGAAVAAARLMSLRANEPPWQGTGIGIEAGQAYSLFAAGRVQWSPRAPTLYGGPRYHLWARVSPGGRIVNPTCESGTFVADVAGEIELGIYMGVWRNELGELATPESLYRRLTGGLEVLVLAWRREPVAALAALVAADAADAAKDRATVDATGSSLTVVPAIFGAELERLRKASAPPAEWRYLLDTGHADIFVDALGPTGEPAIAVHTHDDQGIVCKPVDFALTPTTRLRWRWRVSEQPSALAENLPQTHDYVSIAAEFDNGRDLTWIWSSQLAPGTHFPCPVGAWSARETHWVARSGVGDLGRWCTEERKVYDDVLAAMGQPPSRIVRIWLIAVSSFQHGTARAEFADIVLDDGALVVRVL